MPILFVLNAGRKKKKATKYLATKYLEESIFSRVHNGKEEPA